MPIHYDSAITFLIPPCFRRKKAPPIPEAVGNIFEQRMMQQLKKQNKRSYRAKSRRARPTFETIDLLSARDRSIATKDTHKTRNRHCPHEVSWDSIEDTYLTPLSSVGAEAGGIIGTTHTKNPCDEDLEISSRYTAQLTRQEVSQDAAFRLQQLAHLDMGNSRSSFVYHVPRQSARK